MEVRAVSKYVRISPRKVHKVIGAVKGKSVESGIQTLKFMPQKAASILEKIVRSALPMRIIMRTSISICWLSVTSPQTRGLA
jgi:hypothetical protein